MPRDLSSALEDKAFTLAYFGDCEDGQAVTRKLTQDGATLNSPDLIARLVGWLKETEDSEESTEDAAERAKQEIQSMNLSSSQQKRDAEAEEVGAGGGSSDGTSREEGAKSGSATLQTSSPSSSKPLFGGSK